MAVVSTLPPPPSRIQSPTTFHVDTTTFLKALPQFKEEVNSFCTQLGSISVYKWNMGYIHDEFIETPKQFPYKQPEGVGVQFISDADRLYENMYKNVFFYNGVDVWVKDVERKYGKSVNPKPFPIASINTPPSKSQRPVEFNNTATLFTQANMDNMVDINKYISSVQGSISLQIDCGMVGDEDLTQFIDCGWVVDKNIETEERVDDYHMWLYKTNLLKKQIIKTTLEVFVR